METLYYLQYILQSPSRCISLTKFKNPVKLEKLEIYRCCLLFLFLDN